MGTRKAAGTYSFTDLMLNPVRLMLLTWKGPPGPEAGQADIAAVQAGEARLVGCHLRGSVDPYPRRLKAGALYISAAGTYWVPFLSLHRSKLQIPFKARHVQTRPADHREPRVKHSYGTMMPRYMVVTCTTDPGDGDEIVDFVVPTADAPLVASYLSGSLTQ